MKSADPFVSCPFSTRPGSTNPIWYRKLRTPVGSPAGLSGRTRRMRPIMCPNTRLACLVLVLVAAGCSTPSKEVRIPDPRTISGENREWWDVYSVDYKGDKKVRTRVGYLYRKWGPENLKGNYVVLDPGQNYMGFILPDDYKAYVVDQPRPPMINPTARQVRQGD